MLRMNRLADKVFDVQFLQKSLQLISIVDLILKMELFTMDRWRISSIII